MQKMISTDKTLQLKIASGYFVVLAAICFAVPILLREKQRMDGIEADTDRLHHIQRGIQTAHRHITELSMQGESVISWDETDPVKYRRLRLRTDSRLVAIQAYCEEFLRPGQIDTLRQLLAEKETHLLRITETLRQQEKADSLLSDRLPLAVRQATQPREVTRKRKGIAGWLGAKKNVRLPASPAQLHELNRNLIVPRRERSYHLKLYTDSLRRKNRELNNRLIELVGRLDRQAEASFEGKRVRTEKMRVESFRLLSGVITVAMVLLLACLYVIRRDLRQRKKMEKQNMALLEMRKRIILTLSHDIRGPLSAIGGSAELAIDTRGKKRRDSYLINIRLLCKHILHLLNNLLDVYRLNEAKETRNDVPFRLSGLLARIVSNFSGAINDKGLLFTHEFKDIDVDVIGDVDRIEQITDNLIGNALKFTERGTIRFAATYKSGTLALEVSDTGIGMSEETLSRIFVPFERAAQTVNSQGFGLGLSITKGLVSLMDGEITVESSVGKGSMFRVTLPLVETQEIEKEDSCVIRNITRLPRQVLVVDDDSVQLEVIKEMLERNGVSCETCVNAKEVVQALRKQDFDLILTDVQMPGMDGFSLLKLLRNSNIGNSRTVPVMVMTARGDSDASGFAEAGFLDCIHKPFSTGELLSFISSGIAGQEKNESNPDDFEALTSGVSDKHKILELFIEESERNIAELQEALEKADRKQLCETVHRMFPVWELLQTDDILQTYRRILHDKKTGMEKVRKETEKIIACMRELAMKAGNEIACPQHEAESIDR